MNIGDKVRFLNEVGGGIITGFQDTKTVLVENEDGFEIPMLVSQVVVIDTNDYNIPIKDKKKTKPSLTSVSNSNVEDDDYDPADRPITFRAAPLERRGGDQLSVHLGFTAAEAKDAGTKDFLTHLINDSNYYLQYVYMTSFEGLWQTRCTGLLEPNKKFVIDEFSLSDLPQMEHICLQIIPYKQGKPFVLKPAMCLEQRLDATKFYRDSAFRVSRFFRVPALVYDLVLNDTVACR